MRYVIEVWMGPRWQWERVRCGAGGEPYTFATREEAEKMMRMCYPEQIRVARLGGEETVRIVEIP